MSFEIDLSQTNNKASLDTYFRSRPALGPRNLVQMLPSGLLLPTSLSPSSSCFPLSIASSPPPFPSLPDSHVLLEWGWLFCSLFQRRVEPYPGMNKNISRPTVYTTPMPSFLSISLYLSIPFTLFLSIREKRC